MKGSGRKKIILVILVGVVGGLVAGLFAAGAGETIPRIDPDSYPGVSKAELGQLRFALQLADQDLLDFTNMEGIDQLGMTAYRYLIAFTAYFLALEQYHKFPAWPELIQPRLDRLIAKMLQKPVWEFWAEVSKGVPNLEPLMNRPYPEEHDPVKYRNVMYSGHVTHMIGLYESLYRDLKWSQPGAIVFAWSETEKFVYDNHSLNQVLYDQMMNLPSRCIECEPNACFPECNQHPILGFLLHDQVHGTNFFAASERFFDFFLEKKMIDPETHATAALYLIKQDLTLSNQDPRFKNALDLVLVPLVSSRLVSLVSSSADGWTGAFMHVWQPEYIERHYPYQREHHLREVSADQARLIMTVWEPQLKYGFFAILAAEVGDYETRDKLIAYADTKYDPVEENGIYYYPYNLAKGCTRLTGMLLALARANMKDGLRIMHTQIFDEAHFTEPAVAGVDFPNLLLRRAIYDRARKALIVTTEPGTGAAGKSSFRIVNLDPAQSYRLIGDGQEIKVVAGQDHCLVEVSLDQKHDFILVAE